MTELQHKLTSRGAWVFFIGMVTGLWAAVVLTHGKALAGLVELHPVHERLALAAHLNGLLGCFWLLAVAYTIEHTRYGALGKQRLALLVTIAVYGNWGLTLLASILDVRGLDFEGGTANNVVAGLLQVFVVIPSLIASGAWAYGFSRKPAAS